MADSDPNQISLSVKQEAQARTAAIPQGKRGAWREGQPNGKTETRPVIGKGAPGSWQKQPERQPTVGGEVKTERKESFNREPGFKQSEEQIKEIHKLTNVLITAFHSCEVLVRFINSLKIKSGLFEQEDVDNINAFTKNIKTGLKGTEGFTLDEALSAQRAIRLLALDIEMTVMLESVKLDDKTLQSVYDDNLKAVLAFAKENEITGNRELSPSLTQEISPLVKSSGLKVMRPTELLPAETKHVEEVSSNPTIRTTAPTKSPDEIVAEKLAEEKDRNKKMFERANAGEKITPEILKSASFSDEEAQDFLDVLELTK